jgi:glycosyltransferase involved in cell wall biosynthesis
MPPTKRTERRPRIAVVLQGDIADPRVWSGSPAGLFAGLREAGADPVAIDARPPGAGRIARILRVHWEQEAASPAFAAASGAWATASVHAARGLDGIVAIGSGYRIRTKTPLVTFEDETVAQALRLPYSPPASLPARSARRWQQRQGRIYAHSTGCCVGSHWTARSVEDDYGIEQGKVHVVGFGRNLSPHPAERDWGVPRFLFIGIDWERKRGPQVVEAMTAVRKRHPGASLDVVGGHPHLDAPGVVGHGRLSLSSAGEREKLEGLLSRATCLVLPSAREAFGIAYLDAAAAGVPSIGTTVGGALDAIGDGGVVIDPGDERALVDAMLELSDPDLSRRLGERALARSDLFTWQAVAERVLRALHPAGADVSDLAQFLDPPQT